MTAYVISLATKDFVDVRRKYREAGGKLSVVYVPGVIATVEDRKKSCSRSCRQFCPNSLIGCFMAHQEVWRKICENRQPGLIFEDDVEFVGDLDEASILQQLRDNDLVAFGYIEYPINALYQIHHFLA